MCRFKEHLQWHVDTDGYYSSPTARYIEYGNPDPAASLATEVRALRAAMSIGLALGRIVILPEFRCHGCAVTGAGGTQAGCSGAWTPVLQHVALVATGTTGLK
jgi:hypothetical protein